MAVPFDRIVDLLPLFRAHVAGVFGFDLGRIKNVIAKNPDKRENERCFGSLLRRNLTF